MDRYTYHTDPAILIDRQRRIQAIMPRVTADLRTAYPIAADHLVKDMARAYAELEVSQQIQDEARDKQEVGA